MKFFITTERGLENIIADDIKELGIKTWVGNRIGKIFAEGDSEHVFLLNFLGRSINKVYILIKKAKINSLNDVKEELKDINWEDYIDKGQTFAVSVEKAGRKDFSSIDVARLAGDTIIERIASLRKRPKVDLRNPDVKIRLDIFKDEMLVGIDTTGPSLHMRRYRVFNHPKAVKTTIAYLMIKLSSWSENESLYDPMCGGGTIPIEAAISCRKIPIFVFRGNEYAFYKLKFLPLDRVEYIKERLLESMDRSMNCTIIGSDINEEYIKGAIKNAEKAKVLDTIKFFTANIFHLEFQSIFDKIVLNPPYFVKNLSMFDFYRKLLLKLLRMIREGGKIVLLTPKIRIMLKILDELKLKYELHSFYRQRLTKNGIFIIKP